MTPIEQVTLAVARSLNIDPVHLAPETRFVELDIDSLERAQMILDLEEDLKIEIPKEDEHKIFRVQDLVRYLDPISH